MRFHQVRELVSWAADYHGRLQAAYSRLAGGEVTERVRLALEYLADHERSMQRDLEAYLDDGSDHRPVLDAWFDDPNDFPHAPVLERLPGALGVSGVADVLATALTMHRTLQDLYHQRADRAGGREEREFFTALAEGQDAEVRRLTRDMQRLEDY
ncbi:2-hydroxyacyl-CoA dehydratase [Halomonas maura]|uniref:2-hydroxyacyl-CoA dehydratase n=1 Tax=Halomonas maura TaxID=117606 RepID=UPI0025B29F23|nr:2-hydroxyacyl-CoA dehydratase [Halomonas maura]MDN3555290.1 2-hydroxyacyl-CoA dehydratase [Halomonas maura]